MILLTLVENALKHGVGPAIEGGHIRVTASREADCLLMSVADSGHGLTARLGNGTGLANIRQRLLLRYGEQAVLSLRPALPHGVVASVAMPLARS
jgi:LytS/YehU family sensor histidine kinase